MPNLTPVQKMVLGKRTSSAAAWIWRSVKENKLLDLCKHCEERGEVQPSCGLVSFVASLSRLVAGHVVLNVLSEILVH